MRSIFISYRRNDTEGQAGRLFDDLVMQFLAMAQCLWMCLGSSRGGTFVEPLTSR